MKHLPTPGTNDRRRGQPTGRRPERHDTVFLKSLGYAVTVADAVEVEQVGQLVSEDFCWRMACLDQRVRRPPLWQRSERRDWRAENSTVRAQRRHVQQLARKILLDRGSFTAYPSPMGAETVGVPGWYNTGW